MIKCENKHCKNETSVQMLYTLRGENIYRLLCEECATRVLTNLLAYRKQYDFKLISYKTIKEGGQANAKS